MKISRVLVLLVISSLMFQYIPANHSSSEFTTISDNNDIRYNTEANEYEIEVYSQNGCCQCNVCRKVFTNMILQMSCV